MPLHLPPSASKQPSCTIPQFGKHKRPEDEGEGQNGTHSLSDHKRLWSCGDTSMKLCVNSIQI